MKKVLQIILAVMNWLAPFASTVGIVCLPVQAATVQLGSPAFWLYLILALAGIGSLLYAVSGWTKMDWRLRCYEALEKHQVFWDEQALRMRPKLIMVLVAAIVNSLTDPDLAISARLHLFEVIVLPATIANLICLVVVLVVYLYLKLYVWRHKGDCITYEWSLLRGDGSRQYYQDVCQVSELHDTLIRRQTVGLFCEAVFQFRIGRTPQNLVNSGQDTDYISQPEDYGDD